MRLALMTPDLQTTEIALFPIPGSVSLPYTVVPLHVFEPRYRKMVVDSIEKKMRIGVAHTKRETTPPKENASLEEHLKTNQESYEAYPVFSAGYAEVLETLPDGRFIIQIQMDSRYEWIEEVQEIPYKIVRCRPYLDEPPQSESDEPVHLLREGLDQILLRLPVPNAEKLETYLNSEAWTSQSDEQYSYSIYSLVLFEPEILQNVLELRSTFERISFLNDALMNPTSN